MNIGNGGYTQAANDAGPNAGFDKKLFKGDDDLFISRLSNTSRVWS